MIKFKKPISLNELSREINVTKSKLTYYVRIGLIRPIVTVGKMYIFDKEKTMDDIKKIEQGQAAGKTLKEIKKEM